MFMPEIGWTKGRGSVASSGNLVMLAAMRRASLWVSSLASGGFLPTSRLIVLSITGHLVICRTD